MLRTASIEVDADGFADLVVQESKQPFNIEGKRVVLQTPVQLQEKDWTNRIAFHPLSESLVRGESKVLEKYRRTINVVLNRSIMAIFMQLLRLASSPKEQQHLKPEQTEFLSKVKKVEQRTIDDWERLVSKIPGSEFGKTFVSIYLKKQGTVQKVKCRSAGVVSFPFYKQLVTAEKRQVNGITLRVSDLESYKALFEYMLPGIDQPELYYNRGSNSDLAPYTESLLQAILAVAEPINRIAKLFEGVISDGFEIPVEWAEQLSEMGELLKEVRLLPQMPGNEGAVVRPGAETGQMAIDQIAQQAIVTEPVRSAPVAPPPPPAPLVPAVPAPQPQAVYAPPPAPPAQAPVAPPAPGGVVTMDELARRAYAAQAPAPVYPGYPPQYPGQPPVQYPPQLPQAPQGWRPQYPGQLPPGVQPPPQGYYPQQPVVNYQQQSITGGRSSLGSPAGIAANTIPQQPVYYQQPQYPAQPAPAYPTYPQVGYQGRL